MNCPKCEGELHKVDLGGAQVDQCDRCGGVWFDFGELEQVLARADIEQLKGTIDRNPAQDAQRASCPRCGSAGKMIRVKLPGLHIDSCSRCYGQWLDGGELQALQASGEFQTVADFFKNIV